MGRYISWDDIVLKYPTYPTELGGATSAEPHIEEAEAYVEGMFVSNYTIPFSSNNLTIKGMCIDVAIAKALLYHDAKRSNAIFGHVESMANAINMGMRGMVTNSGDLLAADKTMVHGQDSEYHPIFGVGNIEDFVVSSAQMWDEELERV